MSKHRITPLQLITDDLEVFSHPEQTRQACLGGVRWVQLRLKNKHYADMVPIAEETCRICRQHNATLIIDDHIDLALEVNADGVHLGKEDTAPHIARQKMGDEKIIGGTANTLEDIKTLSQEPVDYIGLGPFRYTRTKKKLSPVLGTEGYSNLMKACRNHGINLPVIAIGGIRAEDVRGLLEAGVQGVAVSSAINKAEDPVKAAGTFVENINAVMEE